MQKVSYQKAQINYHVIDDTPKTQQQKRRKKLLTTIGLFIIIIAIAIGITSLIIYNVSSCLSLCGLQNKYDNGQGYCCYNQNFQICVQKSTCSIWSQLASASLYLNFFGWLLCCCGCMPKMKMKTTEVLVEKKIKMGTSLDQG